MSRAALGALLLVASMLGCARFPETAPPSATTQPSTATSTPLPAATATLAGTRALQPTLVATPTATMTASPSAPPTVVAPMATPTITSSPTPSPAATPTPLPPTPQTEAPTSPPALPQEVTTVIPEASWPYVSSLVVTPDKPPRLLAVIGGVLYVSADRARSWQPVDLTGVDGRAAITAVAIDYRRPATMYLMTSQGIYRREGDGAWAFVHTLKALSLAVDLVDSNTLWAGVPYSTEYDAILLKSNDRGRTWGGADAGMFGGPGADVGAIAIDPLDPNIFYANTRYAGRFGWPLGGLFRGGRDGHWEQLDIVPHFPAGCLPNGLAFDPHLRRLYVGCDVYYYNERQFTLRYSDNAHAANSAEIGWNEATMPWPTQPDLAYGAVRPLAMDAETPMTLYLEVTEYTATEARHTMLVSEDNGATWQRLALP